MNTSLKVTLIQSELHWEHAQANLANFTKLIDNFAEATHLVILPEMFTTGFSMNAPALAESMDGHTVRWMQQIATEKQIAITGSVIIQESGAFYNRLIFVYPNGTLVSYDKRHTFTLAGEDKVYTAGTANTLIEYKDFTICPQICYDLRFPVWARNTCNYDLLFYVANWPKVRTNAWDALLKARAIENMSYCIGVNRIGTDGLGYEYSGHSAVYDPLGELISTSAMESAFAQTVVLDKAKMLETRQKLGFLNDRDSFNLSI